MKPFIFTRETVLFQIIFDDSLHRIKLKNRNKINDHEYTILYILHVVIFHPVNKIYRNIRFLRTLG